MSWPSLRDFLQVPPALTGRGVAIAVIDGDFPPHPDIATDPARRSFVVQSLEPGARPLPLHPAPGPWPHGAHSLWAAAAAAGSGALCRGQYPGMAPEADLFLVRHWSPDRPEDLWRDHATALRWVRDHYWEYGIRGVLTAIAGQADTGLLPWQIDPLRILCEELADAGLLVVAGTGNITDFVCRVTEAAAPSSLAVGGVIIPKEGSADDAPPYHGCRGVTFDGKWVPQVLAPAENLVLPWGSDEVRREHAYAGLDDLPEGYARTEGTSFAGPIALGAAACVWQAHPDWDARRMRAALVQTALRRPLWAPLAAGLLSVAGAAASGAVANAPEATPFARWRAWRGASMEGRLRAIVGSDPERATQALGSFLPEGLPTVAVLPARSLLRHASPRLRTLALCALAVRPEDLAGDDLLPALDDDTPSVRMAAIYALDRCPQLWPATTPRLVERLRDPSPDIRYWAIRLAGKAQLPAFVAPLVAGLEPDARGGCIAAFGARCTALQAITGHEFPLDPPWRDGQCPYAERTLQARLSVAARWQDWLGSR